MILKLRNQRLINVGTPYSRTTAQMDATDTTITILSDDGFTGSDKYVLFGEFGDENSEIAAFDSVATNVLTVAAVAKDHPEGTPVYLLNANQVQFMRSTTATGVYAELDVMTINPEMEFTVYEDTTNSTGYGKARFYNEDADEEYGSYYEIIRYDEDDRKTRGFIKQVSLDRLGAAIDGNTITEDFLNNEIKMCDDKIRQERIRWTQESTRLILELDLGITEYDLSSYLKNLDTIESIQGVYYNGEVISIVKRDVFVSYLGGAQHTYLAADVDTTDTEIEVTDASVLDDDGSIVIEGDTIDYTARDIDTNILSGVTNIDSAHTTTSTNGYDTEVWQGVTVGKPYVATVIDGKLLTYPYVDSSSDVYNLEIDLVNKYTQITLDSDTLEFPPELYVSYLMASISRLRGDADFVRYEDKFASELLKTKMRNGSVIERRLRPRISIYNQNRRTNIR